MDIISILGMPVPLNGMLLNTAVVIQKGKILGVVPKTYLPNYKEFYEKRWFASACEVSETTARLCGQVVPMGRNLLLRLRIRLSELRFARICGSYSAEFFIGVAGGGNPFQSVG